jgi:hypothetical protein
MANFIDGGAMHTSDEVGAQVPFEEVLERETRLLEGRAKGSFRRPGFHMDGDGSRNGRDYRIGIGLSGGGIRSATVCLGILQAFAKAGLLKHVDYMSSVSGGGYTAAAVAMRYAQQADRGVDPDDAFPYGKSEERPEKDALKHLRNHANYLTPDGLRGIATGTVVVARSLFLNLFIWIALGGALFALLMLPQRAGECLTPIFSADSCGPNTVFDLMLVLAGLLTTCLVLTMVGFSLSSWRMKTDPRDSVSDPSHGLRGRYLIGLGLFAVLATVFISQAAVPGEGERAFRPFYLAGAVLAALAALGFAAMCMIYRDRPDLSRKYARRRFQEWLSGWLVLVIVALVIVGTVPAVFDGLKGLFGSPNDAGPPSLLLVTYLVALATALYGFYRTNLRGTLGLGSAVVIVAGSVFVLWSAMLVAHQLGLKLYPIYQTFPHPLAPLQAVYFILPIIALALGFFANINDVSLGRFYRDRLMEAFMPDQHELESGNFGPAAVADRFKLPELLGPVKLDKPRGRLASAIADPSCVPKEEGNQQLLGPYPLINANVMTPWHPDPVPRSRGGDNFVLAPGHCGSSVSGWRRTEDVMKGRFPLATAMAISGAAANPRGGFGGSGPTTNYAVAVAMSLLSVRLGYWLRWDAGGAIRTWLNPFGNHFVPSATSLTPWYKSGFVELTDGGHFENLGIYELIRRRCGLIVICDGGDDRSASYAALTVAARRVKEDFGATFDFAFKVRGDSQASGPQHIVARSVSDEYPKDAEYAERGFFLARVRYGDPAEARAPMAQDGPKLGLVIYLKSAMLRDLSLTSRGYKGANPDFPYESTADQFFSPEQFEAYRDVGLRTAEQMLKETDLMHHFSDDERPSLWSMRSTFGFSVPESDDWQPFSKANEHKAPSPNGQPAGNSPKP